MVENADVKKKVLMIDDDEMNLDTAEMFLKNDFEIIKMNSGQGALSYLNDSESLPNVILLDIIMPNMDGWAVLKNIKSIEKLKGIPIAFLTSVASEEEKKKAFKYGISDFIHKPFNMVTLKERINEMLDPEAKKTKPLPPGMHHQHHEAHKQPAVQIFSRSGKMPS